MKRAEEKDSRRKIVLLAGETLRIVLEENPSAGYLWRYRRSRGLLTLKRSRFDPPGAEPTGGGGTRRFDFVSSRSGRARISFSYRRSWEKKPLRTVSFEIEVKPQDSPTSPGE